MPASPLILAIGDSLIAGYGLAQADGFAPQLERRLRPAHPNVRVVNAGVSGNTSADVLRRLPGALSRLDRRPDLAIVQVGPNDVLRMLPPAATRANLDAVLVELGRCGVPVLLTTVDPPPILRGRADAYLGLHAELAERHGATVHSFFPPGVLGAPAMVLADCVHPNAPAIAAVVDAMLPAIERMLASGVRAAA
jgi:acyl-CoA thioesterase I